MDSITKQIQAITLDILLHFDAVFKKNGLTYYLAYGSLLGGYDIKGSFLGMMTWMYGCPERNMRNF